MFDSIAHLQSSLNLMLPQVKHHYWDVCPEPKLGQVAGLPNSFGKVVASNGMFVLVMRSNSTVEFYHAQHFQVEKEVKEKTAKGKVALASFEEFNL